MTIKGEQAPLLDYKYTLSILMTGNSISKQTYTLDFLHQFLYHFFLIHINAILIGMSRITKALYWSINDLYNVNPLECNSNKVPRSYMIQTIAVSEMGGLNLFVCISFMRLIFYKFKTI